MKVPIKYFLFNKELDYSRGTNENILITQKGIELENLNEPSGVFISRLLDSKEKQTIWHRIVIDQFSNSGSSIQIKLFFTDLETVAYGDKTYNLKEALSDPDLSMALKQKLSQPFCQKVISDPYDTLLFDCVGRYMWYEILMNGQGGETPRVEKVKIYFPKNTWTEHLPELYQDDSKSSKFVERFLGIFQSIYQDLSHEIDSVSDYLEPEAIGEELMLWLSDWIAIDNSYVWSEDQLRYLLKNALNLYKIRGTVEYLEKMVGLYTGQLPYIIETHQLKRYMADESQYDVMTDLYGDNPYVCTILVASDKGLSNRDIEILNLIINNCIPAYLEGNIIILEPYVFLNHYTYLGVNSKLSEYNDFVLDGRSALPFTTL